MLTSLLFLPACVFAALIVLEHAHSRGTPGAAYSPSDRLLNLAGLAVQGIAVPAAGYLIASRLLATRWPEAAGSLPLGWWGAFALNFVFVDFLYYWQHRLFHRAPGLWALHLCHHASSQVSVWAASRNSLAINFLFVYLLVNPVLGFLCDRPDGFFAGAAVTASLDLWRHARLPGARWPAWLRAVLITPEVHHDHHSPGGQQTNFGANLVWWDRLFGTARGARGYPAAYGTPMAPGPWRQFLFPW